MRGERRRHSRERRAIAALVDARPALAAQQARELARLRAEVTRLGAQLNDLAGPLPVCPEGGVYTIGSIDEKPKCSISGHVLP